jgi:hypothetical protein
MKWGDKYRSQLKTALCSFQHTSNLRMLEECARITGLPLREFTDHLDEPDPSWLRSIGVLLLVGENDKGHWAGVNSLEAKREMHVGRMYEQAGARTHVVLVPHYGHYGFMGLHNEHIAYCWLWACQADYFG